MAELAGINLTDFLEEGKGTGSGGQTQGGKGKPKVIKPVSVARTIISVRHI